MKPVGKPDAGDPRVRFDERGRETGLRHPRPSSTLRTKGRKRHILVDTLGMLLKVEVHSAGIQDRDGAALVSTSSPTAFPLLRKSVTMAAIRVQRSKRARDRW
jgi:hypothetical protein